MRVSVQVRLPGGGSAGGGRCIVDAHARAVALPLDEFEPAERRSRLRPTAARIRSVLFVVDTLNTLPGSAGTLTLDRTWR